MNEISFTVPLVPPGVNHYAKHTRTGRHYVTTEAKAFKNTVSVLSAGRFVIGKKFEVEAIVYLGEGQKGDVDGFSKLLLDGMAEAWMFRKSESKKLSDAHVTDLILRKRRDRENPRTEITVRAIEQANKGVS